MLICLAGEVESVTQLNNVVYILCSRSSTVLRYNAITHQPLTDIDVFGLMSPHVIVACEQTSQLYVADFECVWRVSSDGSDILHWLPRLPSDTMKPWTLSVTASRLLVTSPETKQVIQFNADGDELRRVQLPDHFLPRHAVESRAGTFIVSYSDKEADQDMVTEVDDCGQLLRQFGGCPLPSVRWPNHLDVDSRGRIFLADAYSGHILLLSARLSLCRVIIDEHHLNDRPLHGFCYVEQTGHLLVALDNNVTVFEVLGC